VKNTRKLNYSKEVKKEKRKAKLTKRNGKMILINQNIVTVGSLHLVRWLCAKTHTVKKNGFTVNALIRKNCLRNGIAKNVAKKSERDFYLFDIQF